VWWNRNVASFADEVRTSTQFAKPTWLSLSSRSAVLISALKKMTVRTFLSSAPKYPKKKTLVVYVLRPRPIVLVIRVVWRWVRSNGGMILTGVSQSTWRKSYPNATFCTTNVNGMVRDRTRTSFLPHRENSVLPLEGPTHWFFVRGNNVCTLCKSYGTNSKYCLQKAYVLMLNLVVQILTTVLHFTGLWAVRCSTNHKKFTEVPLLAIIFVSDLFIYVLFP
jgi:hypothetical protein